MQVEKLLLCMLGQKYKALASLEHTQVTEMPMAPLFTQAFDQLGLCLKRRGGTGDLDDFR